MLFMLNLAPAPGGWPSVRPTRGEVRLPRRGRLQLRLGQGFRRVAWWKEGGSIFFSILKSCDGSIIIITCVRSPLHHLGADDGLKKCLLPNQQRPPLN